MNNPDTIESLRAERDALRDALARAAGASTIMPRITGHFTNGGTGITNFGREKLDLYERALAEFEQVKPNALRIEKSPMEGSFYSTAYSLHYVGARFDTEAFWGIFERLKIEALSRTSEEGKATKAKGAECS